MSIVKPQIDSKFRSILRHLSHMTDSVYMGRLKTSTGTPFPVYLFEVLLEIAKKHEMNLAEYIIYLKVYKRMKFFSIYTKKEKEQIMCEIEKEYYIKLTLDQLNRWLNIPDDELVGILGYDLETKRVR